MAPVCVFVCVFTYVPVMYIHTWMPICIVLDLLWLCFWHSLCVCVFVTASVFIEGKCPRLFFFFFFTLYFQTHKAMTLSIWNIKKCRAKPASDSSVLLTRLRLITSEKNTTKDLRNMRHENKFLDLNMERVIQTSTPRLLNIIRNREEILNVRKQTGWEYRGV